MKKVISFLLKLGAMVSLGALLTTGFLYGAIREAEIRNQERLDRCAAAGESLSAEMTGYCDGQ